MKKYYCRYCREITDLTRGYEYQKYFLKEKVKRIYIRPMIDAARGADS